MNIPEAPLYFKISIKSLLFVIERLTVFEMIWYDKNMIAITNTKNKKIARLIRSSISSIYLPLYSISSTKSYALTDSINKSTWSNSKLSSFIKTLIYKGKGL